MNAHWKRVHAEAMQSASTRKEVFHALVMKDLLETPSLDVRVPVMGLFADHTATVKFMRESRQHVCAILDSRLTPTILRLVVLTLTSVMEVMALLDFVDKEHFVPTSQDLITVTAHQDLQEIPSATARTLMNVVDDSVHTDSVEQEQPVLTLLDPFHVHASLGTLVIREKVASTLTSVLNPLVRMESVASQPSVPILPVVSPAAVLQDPLEIPSHSVSLNMPVRPMMPVQEMQSAQVENVFAMPLTWVKTVNIRANNFSAENTQSVNWIQMVSRFVSVPLDLSEGVTVSLDVLTSTSVLPVTKLVALMPRVGILLDHMSVSALIISKVTPTLDVNLLGKKKKSPVPAVHHDHVQPTRSACHPVVPTNVSVDEDM